ncbi:MAG TPA: CheR family methyltransferase, partial [Polyangiales bacterium]
MEPMLGPTQRGESEGLPTRVVAIGASAGGLASLQQLFAVLPDDTGMAFVVVQHLSPNFKRAIPGLLSRQTRMKVLAIDGDTPLRANTVYVLKRRFAVQLSGTGLHVVHKRDGAPNLPISALFESLAVLGDHAAAIVLSGTGQDGLTGARAVTCAGGLVVAQTPSSARFDSLPRAIIDAGLADVIATPAEIGQLLVQWLEDPATGRKFASQATDGDTMRARAYGPVLNQLQRSYNLDFNHYQPSTLMARIDRWRADRERAVPPSALGAPLASHPAEVDRLFTDLMVDVTRFFRDPEAFETLRIKGIEPMIDRLGEGDQLRVWCCGCSTGEEAYSLAMLALEAFDRRGTAPRVRVLATDVHPASVQRASSGVFAEHALDGLPAELRSKYFTELPTGHYRVTESLRRCVVFSVQNALRDAGFQRIDIVSCRNMLSYLRPAAQAHVLASFHAALNAGGLMFLGKGELPSEHAEAFLAVDEAAHLFRKRPRLQLPSQARSQFGMPATQRRAIGTPLHNRTNARLQEVLAQRYVPSGFLVNASDELVYVFGNAGQYLQAAAGRFGGTMYNLLAGELRTAVMTSLRKAAQSLTMTSVTDVSADPSEPGVKVRIDVDPIADRTLPHPHFMVRITSLVRDVEAQVLPPLPRDEVTSAQVLETERVRTREALQHCIEDLENTNQELQTDNEALRSANEELRSLNEEHEL